MEALQKRRTADVGNLNPTGLSEEWCRDYESDRNCEPRLVEAITRFSLSVTGRTRKGRNDQETR
jgi:hypothetical protein